MFQLIVTDEKQIQKGILVSTAKECSSTYRKYKLGAFVLGLHNSKLRHLSVIWAALLSSIRIMRLILDVLGNLLTFGFIPVVFWGKHFNADPHEYHHWS